MEHAEAHGGDHVAAFERARLGMWLFVASEIMMFGAFIAVYVVLRMSTNRELIVASQHHLSVPIAAFNTAVLIVSSFTMVQAVRSIREGGQRRCAVMCVATAALGALFLVVKGFEWGAKFHDNIWANTNVFYGCYFFVTGFHGLHVLIGVLVLGVLAFFAKKFDRDHYAHVENTALYWHFVDLVWIFLFPIIYLL